MAKSDQLRLPTYDIINTTLYEGYYSTYGMICKTKQCFFIMCEYRYYKVKDQIEVSSLVLLWAAFLA